MSDLTEILDRLWSTIESRRGADQAASWTARLIADPSLAAKKLGEEAVETAIAAVIGDKAALAREAADLLYHLLAVLAARGVTPDDVARVLADREGVSGVEEKAGRT